jgi:hypothetical protein
MECRGWRQRARRAETARLPRPATRPRVAEATLTVPLLLAVRARRARMPLRHLRRLRRSSTDPRHDGGDQCEPGRRLSPGDRGTDQNGEAEASESGRRQAVRRRQRLGGRIAVDLHDDASRDQTAAEKSRPPHHRVARPSSHVLLTSRDAWSSAEGDPRPGRTSEHRHHEPIPPPGARRASKCDLASRGWATGGRQSPKPSLSSCYLWVSDGG